MSDPISNNYIRDLQIAAGGEMSFNHQRRVIRKDHDFLPLHHYKTEKCVINNFLTKPPISLGFLCHHKQEKSVCTLGPSCKFAHSYALAMFVSKKPYESFVKDESFVKETPPRPKTDKKISKVVNPLANPYSILGDLPEVENEDETPPSAPNSPKSQSELSFLSTPKSTPKGSSYTPKTQASYNIPKLTLPLPLTPISGVPSVRSPSLSSVLNIPPYDALSYATPSQGTPELTSRLLFALPPKAPLHISDQKEAPKDKSQTIPSFFDEDLPYGDALESSRKNSEAFSPLPQASFITDLPYGDALEPSRRPPMLATFPLPNKMTLSYAQQMDIPKAHLPYEAQIREANDNLPEFYARVLRMRKVYTRYNRQLQHTKLELCRDIVNGRACSHIKEIKGRIVSSCNYITDIAAFYARYEGRFKIFPCKWGQRCALKTRCTYLHPGEPKPI